MKIGAHRTTNDCRRLAPAKPALKAAIGAGARRRKNASPELALHKAVAQFLDRALTSESWWTTIPGGMRANPREGAKYKALGYKAGTPDILIVHRGIARFVELKAPQGILSESQFKANVAIFNAGGAVACMRSLEALESWLRAIGIPLCASVSSTRARAA